MKRLRCLLLSTLWLCVTCTVACVDSSARITSLARSPHFVTDLTQEITQGPLAVFAQQAKDDPENRSLLQRIQGPLAQGLPAVIMGSDASAWVYPLAKAQPTWQILRLNSAVVAQDAWKTGLAARHFPQLVNVIVKQRQRACEVHSDCEGVVFVVGDDIKQLTYAAPKHSLDPYQSPPTVESEGREALQELLTSGPVLFTLSLDSYHEHFGNGRGKISGSYETSGIAAAARATGTDTRRAKIATLTAPTTLWPPPRTPQQFARDTRAIEAGWKKHGLPLPKDLTDTTARLGYACMRGPTSAEGPVMSFIKGMEEFSRAQKTQAGTVFGIKQFALKLVADTLGEDPKILANQPVLLPKSREQALQDASNSAIGACFGQQQRQELTRQLRQAAAHIVELALTFQADLLAVNAELDDASRRYIEGELRQRLDHINGFLPGFAQSIGARDVKLAGEAVFAVSHALRAGRIFRDDHPTAAIELDQKLEKMAGLARKLTQRSGSPTLQAAIQLANNKGWRDAENAMKNPFADSSNSTSRLLQESLLFQLRALWNEHVGNHTKPDVKRAMEILGYVVLGIAQDGPGTTDSKRRELVVISTQTLHATLEKLPDWKSTPVEFLAFAKMVGYYATEGKRATDDTLILAFSHNNSQKSKTADDDSTKGKLDTVTTQTSINRLTGLWGLPYKIFDVQGAEVLPKLIAYHLGVQQAIAGGFNPVGHDAAGLPKLETALFGTPAKPKHPDQETIRLVGIAIDGWPVFDLPPTVMTPFVRLMEKAALKKNGLGKNRKTFLSLLLATKTVAEKFSKESGLYRDLTTTSGKLADPSSPLHTSDKGRKHKFEEMIPKFGSLVDKISNNPDRLQRDLGKLFARIVQDGGNSLNSSIPAERQYAEVMLRAWEVENVFISQMGDKNEERKRISRIIASFCLEAMNEKLIFGKTVKTLTDNDKSNAKKEIEKINKITKKLKIEIQNPAFEHPDVIVALQMIAEFSAAAAKLINKIPSVSPDLITAIAREFQTIRGVLPQDGKAAYDAMLKSVASLKNNLAGLAF